MIVVLGPGPNPCGSSEPFSAAADSILMDVRDAAGIARRRGDGPWSDALGADPAGYVYIERLIHSEREIRCLSRMYLPAGRFGAVLDGRLLRQVNPFNVKLLLRKEFGAHTVATEQIIRFISLDAGEAAALRRNVGETAIQFEATGIDQNGVPITFHEIVIPPSDCLLDLTFTGVPGRARSRAISEPAPRPPRATDSPSPGDR